MKDRITLGHDADVAETAALTLADNRATERVYAALDWEREEKGREWTGRDPWGGCGFGGNRC